MEHTVYCICVNDAWRYHVERKTVNVGPLDEIHSLCQPTVQVFWRVEYAVVNCAYRNWDIDTESWKRLLKNDFPTDFDISLARWRTLICKIK